MTRYAAAVTVLVALIGGPGLARAAHFEKLDEQITKEVSPGLGQQVPVCTGDASLVASTFVDPDRAGVTSRSSASVASNQMDCMLSEPASLTLTLMFTVVADSEAPGTEVPLCLREAHSLTASDSGEATAIAEFGGDPITGPFEIVRLPANEVLYSTGPFAVTNDSEIASVRRLLTARIGDTIQIQLRTIAFAQVFGVGTGNTDIDTDLLLRIGPCAAPAPVMSHGPLAALALVLGGLGAVLLRRRRS